MSRGSIGCVITLAGEMSDLEAPWESALFEAEQA